MKTLSLRARILFPLCYPSNNWSTPKPHLLQGGNAPKKEEQKELSPQTTVIPVGLLGSGLVTPSFGVGVGHQNKEML